MTIRLRFPRLKLITALLLGGCVGLWAVELFAKETSIIVTATMRENAQRNVEKYDWARRHRDALLAKLKPWLEVGDEELWKMLPSQGMPRSSSVDPPECWPPGSGKEHLAAALKTSRGFGRPSRYYIDPFKHPWKVQSIGSGEWYPKNDFAAYYESALDKGRRFHLGRGDARYLISEGPKETRTWVDNGRGMLVDGKRFYVAAHYAFRLWTELIDVTSDLAELYTITGDPAYARRAGMLLDRMADLYPEMDYQSSAKLGMEASTGGSGEGRVQGRIWECWTAQKLSIAYDLIYDALVKDEQLAAFSQSMADRYAIGDKSTPGKIAQHIEDHLLREFVVGIKDWRIKGNAGMHQHAMAAVAIALDHGEETTQGLDWLFSPTGGALPKILIDEMSRDGFGVESGLGYASIPPKSIYKIACLLARYPSYTHQDLFKDYPKFRNALSSGERVRMADGASLHWGDGGAAMRLGRYGYPVSLEMALKGAALQGREENYREVFNAAGRNARNIPGDIYAKEAEGAVSQFVGLLEEKGDDFFKPRSFNSGGIGFGVLQSPHSANHRAVALNYGTMGWGHGHGDRLGLHLISDGCYMATDLGYPTTTQFHPPRFGWTSHVVSHNTVMVDDRAMERYSSFSGKTRLFAEAGPVRVMDVDGGGPETQHGDGHSVRLSQARPIYPQCSTYRRAVVMVDVDAQRSYYLDLFWVRGGHRHRLIQNGGGEVATSSWPKWRRQEKGTLAGENVGFGVFYDGAMKGDYGGSGLMYLDRVERAWPDRPFYVDWAIHQPGGADQAAHLRVHNLTPLKEAATATGQTPQGRPDSLRYLVRTVEQRETQFLSLLEPYRDEPFIREVRELKMLERPKGFSAAVEIELADGRRDWLLVTEEGGRLAAGSATLEGRIGWLRWDKDGKLSEMAAVDASLLRQGEAEMPMATASLKGAIVSIDESDPDNVVIQTSLDQIPESFAGSYFIVRNHQRADASYCVREVLSNGRVNIGCAALSERLVDPNDYTKGVHKNIIPGETFHLANTHHFLCP